ncbi:MAG: hypothetical protein AAGE76_02535 [Pseudomonadota bacterium]
MGQIRARVVLLCFGGSMVLAGCDPISPLQGSVSDPAAGATAAAPADVLQPPGLTADEVVIWNTLRPDVKARAAEFIAGGGTLTQFVQV